MSTLGGTRGERNAKPKFAALDINKLYITSRGESLEPSTQKSTAPRKHGMQSLGKVPSARRPANLPSLKAETSSPSDQSSWGAENTITTSSITNISSSTTNTTPIIQNANNSTARFPALNTIPSINANETPIQPTLNSQKTLNSSPNSSASWSALTVESPTIQKTLYQSSSHFQNEFPSLDGPGQIGISNKQDGQNMQPPSALQNYTDGTQVSLRPQTDASGWLQQQGINMGRGENTGLQTNQQGQAPQELPPQFRALMPPFMYRSGGGFTGNSNSQPSNLLPSFSLPPQSHSQQNYSMNQGNKPLRMQYNDQNYYQGNIGQSNRRNQPPPRLSYVPNKEQTADNRQSTPVESDILVQRPIIREEELERIESIAKDEGWAKHDEIDYNQKLQFSDDEGIDHSFSSKMNDLDKSPTNAAALEVKKIEEEKRIIGRSWSREVEREVERQELERLEKEKLEISMEMEIDREKQTEKEREMQRPQQQNSRGLDAETVERLKQRREEEEKKVLERKLAANKKLQELEQKMSRKKTEEKDEDCSSRTSSFNEMFDLKLMTQDTVKNYPERNNNNNNNTRAERERDNNIRYEYNTGKFDRDANRDTNKESYTRDRENRDMPSFSKTFQSNLPPRFQRQQLERGTTSSCSSPNAGYNNNNNNSNNGNTANNRNNQNDSKKVNVPFAQQYDPRFIHQQNYNKNQQVGNRRQTTEDIARRDKREDSRKRMDSEEDDRFSSGQESNGKTPQLARSISDSSQRKISISSDDNKLNDSNSSVTLLEKSAYKEMTSWENEAEIEFQNLEKIESTFSNKVQENINPMYNESDDVPKQILQRKKEHSPSLLSEDIDRISRSDESVRIEKSTSFKHLSENPKTWEESSNSGDHVEENTNMIIQKSLSNGSIDVSIDEKQKPEIKAEDTYAEKKILENIDQSADKKEHEHNKSTTKKQINRSNSRHDAYPRGMSSRGYTAYRGGSWNRRGGPRTNMSGRNYNQDYYNSDSDYSDEYEDDYKRGGINKSIRKDGSNQYNRQHSSNATQNQKEGFAPRGEPSRRGRGGNSNSSGAFRKPIGKRIEGYGPPSSKSPFGNNEERVDNKTVKEMKTETTNSDKHKQISVGNISMTKRQSPPQQIQKSGSGNMKPPGKPSEEVLASQGGTKGDLTKSTDEKNNQEKLSEIETESDTHKNEEKDIARTSNDKPKIVNEKGFINSSLIDSSDMVNEVKIKNVEQFSHKAQSLLSTNPSRNKSLKDERRAEYQPNRRNQMINKQPQPSKPSLSKPIINQNATSKESEYREDRNVRSNLPPRLAKQKENRMQRNVDDTNGQLENSGDVLSTSFSHNTHSDFTRAHTNSNDTTNTLENLGTVTNVSNQRSTPTSNLHGGNEKLSTLNNKTDNAKQLLDPPVNTIIFENTNYKSAPHGTVKRQAGTPTMVPVSQKQDEQNGEGLFKSTSSNAMPEIIEGQNAQKSTIVNSTPQSQAAEALTSALQAGMAFQKQESEYEKDMKLFTFETEISQLTDEKNSTKGNLCLPKSIHSVTSVTQNIISPSTADLNMKIASVKKVWEVPVMPTVIEHSTDDAHIANFVTQQHLQQYSGNMVHNQHQLASAPTYTPNFGQDQASLDHFNKQNNETISVGEVENTYVSNAQHGVNQVNHVQHQSANMNLKHSDVLASNTNVCKVKPTQQQIHPSGLGLSQQSGFHTDSPGFRGGNAVSPPPMQQGTLQSAPQQYYQSQYGNMSAIPSPPTVLYNSSPMPSQGNLFNPFQIDAGRSQFSQFPTHYGTAGNAPYSYMTTPPNIQTAPTPDMYQNYTSQLRMSSVQAPFNQSQQMNNPSTVLISSSSNSLMSASVKPSSQQIGAIGSKSGTQLSMPGNTVGQPYGQNAIHGQQYMGMFQQAPPMQNNSFYSSSASGQAPFFGGTGTTQNYGIQAASMFGGQPSNPQAQLAANFGSQFLSSPLQLANAINQQYRGCPNTNPQAAYMKSNQPQSHMQDPNGRQLKSPLNNDGINNLKQMTSQQSSPPHHKAYVQSPWEMQNQVMQQQQQQQSQQQQQQTQNRNLMSSNNANLVNRPSQVQNGPQRYPAPIQRPTNNYMQTNPGNQQRATRPPSQANVQQQSINANKHYFNTTRGGGHVNAGNDSNIVGKSANEKNLDNSNNDIVKNDTKKE